MIPSIWKESYWRGKRCIMKLVFRSLIIMIWLQYSMKSVIFLFSIIIHHTIFFPLLFLQITVQIWMEITSSILIHHVQPNAAHDIPPALHNLPAPQCQHSSFPLCFWDSSLTIRPNSIYLYLLCRPPFNQYWELRCQGRLRGGLTMEHTKEEARHLGVFLLNIKRRVNRHAGPALNFFDNHY